MGMYDEFYFKDQIYCHKCGVKVDSIQSKEFSCDCRMYKPGDEFPGYNNIIVKEEMICDNFCGGIYWDIVIEDGKYMGMFKHGDDDYAELKYPLAVYNQG